MYYSYLFYTCNYDPLSHRHVVNITAPIFLTNKRQLGRNVKNFGLKISKPLQIQMEPLNFKVTCFCAFMISTINWLTRGLVIVMHVCEQLHANVHKVF